MYRGLYAGSQEVKTFLYAFYMHLLEKIEILNIGGQKKIYQESEIAIFNALNSTSFGAYRLCFTSNLYILEAFKHLPLLTQNRGI